MLRQEAPAGVQFIKLESQAKVTRTNCVANKCKGAGVKFAIKHGQQNQMLCPVSKECHAQLTPHGHVA